MLRTEAATFDLYEIGGPAGFYVGQAKHLRTGGWTRRIDAHFSGRGSSSAQALLIAGEPRRLIGSIHALPRYVSTLEARAWMVRVEKGWKPVHSQPRQNWKPVPGMKGRSHSPETRAKIAAAISAATKGKKKSPEHCKRIGDGHRGVPKSAEARAKLSASRMGIPPANKGIPWSAEIRAKCSGRVNSPETLLKMSLSAKRRAASNKRGSDGRYGCKDAS